MAQPKTKKVVEKVEDQSDVMYLIRLVDKVRKSSNRAVVDVAFEKIVAGLESKMKKIAGKFRIPGYSFDDIYQEALYALKFKAIKDYDQTRGSGEGPAPFDRFALLCIRRHLATTLKTSYQNRKKILIFCKSLDQDYSSEDDDLSLINIIPQNDVDICTEITQKEFFRTLVNKLLSKLSDFEKKVFYLYARQHTYEEIAEIINQKHVGDKSHKSINIKAIDNALSRVKSKSKHIYKNQQNKDEK